MYEWLNLEQGSCWQYELRSEEGASFELRPVR